MRSIGKLYQFLEDQFGSGRFGIHGYGYERGIAIAKLVEAEVEERDELIRDLHRVMWACREVDCPHRKNGCFRVKDYGDGECWFEQRIRELGIEVNS